MAQLRELSKQKPRTKTDENLLAELSRLESAITIARDDLVSETQSHALCVSSCRVLPERDAAPNQRSQRRAQAPGQRVEDAVTTT